MSREINIATQRRLTDNLNDGDGEIVERWGSSDGLAILEQLCAEPEAGGASGRFGRGRRIDTSAPMP